MSLGRVYFWILYDAILMTSRCVFPAIREGGYPKTKAKVGGQIMPHIDRYSACPILGKLTIHNPPTPPQRLSPTRGV